ncbi:4-hydroxy-tetrahydrodipicolinate reductase [Persicobacter diffluens]|uniref:4-hydroxy-tetrahydrodipicolinate reductase n=1 Tax=Persicobacter diffluens TaxID=981 RepID=A0AAN4W1L9_9BACT|nr:4-hydroxy-tetrahydrodipicolinate reductase [Persicobacter diffluens]
MNKKRIIVAGATGWAASELCRGIAAAEDLVLVAAISRKNAGGDLNEILNLGLTAEIPIFKTVEEAVEVEADIFVEYTKAEIAKHHVMTALSASLDVIIGTSGLNDRDYQEIATAADRCEQSVLAVGNFAIGVVLLNKFAEMAARYMPSWEIIDYAKAEKKDCPSGSAKELANRLSKVGASQKVIPVDQINGPKEIRGADLNGTQVHSVRLPGINIALESIFGLPDEQLTIKHNAGGSAKPYVGGALLAIRKVSKLKGFQRGLDTVMD